MGNVYQLLRLGARIKSRRVKILGLWAFHVLGRRYLGVFLDPVLACNFRCQMCYFSDAEKRKTYRGQFKPEEIELIASGLFGRALKLQIGCGAEPSLYAGLAEIVRLGKEHRVPYISLTTNGNALTRETLAACVANGLDELTLSTHGFTKETYERLMTNGRFELFQESLRQVAELKREYPDFKLRINYTVNNDNLEELPRVWEVVGSVVDILQVRPIQPIGNSAYQDFDLTRIHARYDELFVPLIEECRRRGIVCLVPEKENLANLERKTENDSRLEEISYCYVSPRSCWREDYDFRRDTFETYAARKRLGWEIWKKAFASADGKIDVTRKMNYNIK